MAWVVDGIGGWHGCESCDEAGDWGCVSTTGCLSILVSLANLWVQLLDWSNLCQMSCPADSHSNIVCHICFLLEMRLPAIRLFSLCPIRHPPCFSNADYQFSKHNSGLIVPHLLSSLPERQAVQIIKEAKGRYGSGVAGARQRGWQFTPVRQHRVELWQGKAWDEGSWHEDSWCEGSWQS